MQRTCSLRKALTDKKLLGSILAGDSWRPWRTLLLAAMGEQLSDAERVIFREFYPRGVTAADALDERTLGTRPSMSHVTAQLEVQGLLAALLGPPVESAEVFAAVDAA